MKKTQNKDTPSDADILKESLTPGGSLDTIRDILFGAQVRESESNARKMEDSFSKVVNELRKDHDKQLDGLRETINNLKLQIEKDNKASAQSIASQMADTQAYIDALDSRTKTAQEDMHDEINSALGDLESQTKGWIEDLAQQLDLVHLQLMSRKADRQLLSGLLNNMASELLAEDPQASKKTNGPEKTQTSKSK